MNEKVLQDCVDELFALQEKTEKSRQEFIQEITALLKKNHQLMIDTKSAAESAKAAAQQSQYSAQHALEQAVAYARSASFWKRFTVWTGAGYFSFGIILSLWVCFGGYQIAQKPVWESHSETMTAYNNRKMQRE